MFLIFFEFLMAQKENVTTFGFKTIRSAQDPNLFITSFKKVFRLRTTMDPITGLESNVVKFENYRKGFKIIVNNEAMCLVSRDNIKIVSCDLILDENLTKWIIDETSDGIKLRTLDNLCLSQGQYDNRDSIDGYELTVEECDSPKAGLWVSRPIESLVYNGDVKEKAVEQNQNGRPDSRKDYGQQNPESNSNITTGWQMEYRATKVLPEKINGFY